MHPTKENKAFTNNYSGVDSTLPPAKSKFSLVWEADIPAAPKFVLMALATYGNADGTSIRPGLPTVARKCGDVTVRQVSRHIQTLLAMGVLKLVRPAVQHYAAHYALCFKTLSALAMPEFRVDISVRPESPGWTFMAPRVDVYGTQGGHISPPTLSDPFVKKGREGDDPTGSAAARPPLVPPQQLANCPEWVDKAALQLVGEMNPKRDMRVLLTKAIEYRQEGLSAEAINAELVSMTKTINAYKVDLRLTVPRAPTKANGRTTTRKTASVVPSVDNTRTPGRYDSMKARAYHAN